MYLNLSGVIKYECSDGTRVSQATIDRRLSEAYREKYSGMPFPCCQDCGQPAQGSSHIVSQKRAKQLRKTELIWNHDNFYPACNSCNSRWESHDVTLPNYDTYMEVMKLFDEEGYLKRLNLTK